MPSQLLDITVRSDWRELSQQAAAQRLHTWRAVQIAVAGATLVVLLAAAVLRAWPYLVLLYLALFGAIYWLLPLWTVLRSQHSVRAALERGRRGFLLVAVAIALACVTRPSLAASVGATPWWLPWLSIGLPFLTWPLLAWLARVYPAQSERLGLVARRWAAQLIIGALAGLLLGLHLWLTAPFVPGLPHPAGPLGPRLIWTFWCQVGLLAVGQELLLRGLAYDALLGGGARFATATIKIVLLNLLVVLALLASAPGVGLAAAAWLLVNGAALAAVATLLRRRQGSLLPGMAASVLFSLFLTAATGL